ncbi:hypothetical protein [Kitasatospora sp. NPDC097691]|uniref:hypothetical protein n=1 Tax=Kitasatospora sp. NPDC097691 TaxID=3157231 RepID=UPI003327F53A
MFAIVLLDVIGGRIGRIEGGAAGEDAVGRATDLADLAWARLFGANLTEADLASVTWDSRTTAWPEAVADRVPAGSDAVGPGVYRVRGGGSSPDRSGAMV